MKALTNYSAEELNSYFKKLHKQIHWLLIYKEEEFPALSSYFAYLLFQLNGLRSMFLNDQRVIDLIVLIESARIEAEKKDYNHSLYRKAILDAHGLISSLEKRGRFNE